MSSPMHISSSGEIFGPAPSVPTPTSGESPKIRNPASPGSGSKHRRRTSKLKHATGLITLIAAFGKQASQPQPFDRQQSKTEGHAKRHGGKRRKSRPEFGATNSHLLSPRTNGVAGKKGKAVFDINAKHCALAVNTGGATSPRGHPTSPRKSPRDPHTSSRVPPTSPLKIFCAPCIKCCYMDSETEVVEVQRARYEEDALILSPSNSSQKLDMSWGPWGAPMSERKEEDEAAPFDSLDSENLDLGHVVSIEPVSTLPPASPISFIDTARLTREFGALTSKRSGSFPSREY